MREEEGRERTGKPSWCHEDDEEDMVRGMGFRARSEVGRYEEPGSMGGQGRKRFRKRQALG